MTVFDNLPKKADLEKELAEVEERRKQLKAILKVVEESEKFQTKATIGKATIQTTGDESGGK